MNIIAKTFSGLEEVLIEEIKEIGGTNIKKLQRSVSFEGDKKILYRANYKLRTALKILVPIFLKIRLICIDYFLLNVTCFQIGELIYSLTKPHNHHCNV